MGLNANKSPWASRAPINTDGAPALDAIITRQYATQYLADRVPAPVDNSRNLRDRIGKKIDTACGNGKLPSINGQYRFGDLVTWARSRKDFAQAVADVALPTTGTAHNVMTHLVGGAFGFSLPPSIHECQAALVDAYRELNLVREQARALGATVEVLTPLQHKANAKSEAARQAGKRGGRPKKK